MELSKTIEELGFLSETEFFELVSGVNLSSSDILTCFSNWKTQDGSKKGLLNIYNKFNIQIPKE
jgi:hypothetical protein